MSTTIAARVEVMGVRHHGPGSARSLLHALDALAPDAVLVEFPADAAPLLRWVRRGLVPPVALLGHVVDRPELAAFWPLAAFSPEWQAFEWALTRRVELLPVDLPLSMILADAQPSDGRQPFDPIGDLAAAAGDPEPERWWEDVVEHRGDGTPAFAAVAEAMAELRRHATQQLTEGEARREAHMREALRRAIGDGHDRVAVVCGAWHAPVLDPDHATATADRSLLRGAPKVKVACSWIPWTHARLVAASGYGAGVESPGWYAHVFEHPGAQGVTRFLVDAARFLREEGFDTSPDHLIGATRLAEALSVMRGRPRPGLAEVLDAADSVFADHRHRGLPGGVLLRRRLVVGDALGEVPEQAPQVPLASDIAATQRRCRLRPVADVRRVELDVRTPNGLARSRLLHRMRAIGLQGALLTEGRGSSGTFRETWELSPEPEDAVRIVECAAYGTTLVAAAAARCVERAQTARSLGALQRVLDVALLAELPDAVGACLDGLRRQGAHDPDLGALVDTLGPLAATIRYGDVRNTDRAAVREVFDDFVDRVLAGIATVFSGISPDAAPLAARRVAAVHAAISLEGDGRRLDRWRDVAAGLAGGREVGPAGQAGQAGQAGLVAGRATRVLHDAGWWTTAAVERRLSLALSPGSPPDQGAAFVEGFLAGSGTVLFHDAELLGLLDTWLCGLTGEAFEQVIPLLRRTFGAFEAAERRRLGWALTDRVAEQPTFGDVDPARLAAAAALAGRLLGLPGEADER